MVLMLLGKKNKEIQRENVLSEPFFAGIIIKKKDYVSPRFTVFSVPKALTRP